MISKDDIVGVALAGGQSKRMGRDKTLLSWPPGADNGRPLWRHALDRLGEVTEDVVLADAGRCLAPSSVPDRAGKGPVAGILGSDAGRCLAPSSSEIRSVPDGAGKGPVAGILGAADARPGRPLLVLAADLPLVPVELLRFLVDVASEEAADWVVPSRERGLEPLCSVFGPGAVERLQSRAESGVFDLHGLMAEVELRIEMIDDDQLSQFSKPDEAFLNVNRVEDWNLIQRRRRV